MSVAEFNAHFNEKYGFEAGFDCYKVYGRYDVPHDATCVSSITVLDSLQGTRRIVRLSLNEQSRAAEIHFGSCLCTEVIEALSDAVIDCWIDLLDKCHGDLIGYIRDQADSANAEQPKLPGTAEKSANEGK